MRYRDAGVDLQKQRALHEAAARLLGGEAGAYARWLPLPEGWYALHVDGVGTKALWLLQAGRLRVAGWDCVFVNVNDVVCDGFRPVALVDYVAVAPGLEEKAADVFGGLEEAARRVGAAVLGGETAVMPDVVSGVDVVCTLLAQKVADTRPAAPGDYLVALESTGPHANGFSLLRRLFKLGEGLCGVSTEDILLAPVADYSPVLELMREGLVKAAAHITGGSFSKLKRALGGLGAEIELGKLPCWAEEVIKRGVPREEAYRVFNMGVGMVLVTDAPQDAVRRAEDFGLKARAVGRVKKEGVVVIDGVVF
ncbi:MAG: phosphoribosylformylglycinamidine cyclo-ligase [Pyrobaculum sp.]